MREIERMRDAARALEPERVLRALDAALGAWRAERSPWRERLAREHPLYSPAVVERGLQLALETWTGEALARLRARELEGDPGVPGVTAVWLAGSVPPSAFSAIALPLLVGSAVYAKAASADPVSPALFAASLREVAPDVGAAVRLGSDERALERSDAVVVYGGDDTVELLRRRVPSGRTFVGYGHKVSLAALGPLADLDRASEDLALDASLWDGRGCLSPAWVLVDGKDRAAALADRLGRALAGIEERLPRGELGPEEHAWLREARARAAVRPGTRLLPEQGSAAWGVTLEPPGAAVPGGSLRFLPVVPVEGPEELERRCAALRPHLSCIGAAGWDVPGGELERIARAGGGSRVCPPGRMQLPPLDWEHDGMRPIRPMLRPR